MVSGKYLPMLFVVLTSAFYSFLIISLIKNFR